MAKPLRTRVSRGSAPLATGIAQTERLVLAVFGAVTAFAGFLVLLIGDGLHWFRFLVGVPVVVIGAGLTMLAVRVQSGGTISSETSPQTLLLAERFVLLLLAVVAFVSAAALAMADPLHWVLRVSLLLMTLVLTGVFATAGVANRLPERTPPPVRALGDTDD